jgi:hypothetical protein
MSNINRSVGDISDLDVCFWAAEYPALHFGGNRHGKIEIWPKKQIFSHSKCARVYVLGRIF